MQQIIIYRNSDPANTVIFSWGKVDCVLSWLFLSLSSLLLPWAHECISVNLVEVDFQFLNYNKPPLFSVHQDSRPAREAIIEDAQMYLLH